MRVGRLGVVDVLDAVDRRRRARCGARRGRRRADPPARRPGAPRAGHRSRCAASGRGRRRPGRSRRCAGRAPGCRPARPARLRRRRRADLLARVVADSRGRPAASPTRAKPARRGRRGRTTAGRPRSAAPSRPPAGRRRCRHGVPVAAPDGALSAAYASIEPCQSRWSGARLSTAPEMDATVERPVQLEAGQLDGEHVVRLVAEHRVQEREADVARATARCPAALEDRGEHLHGRGLAVGAGDREPRLAGAARAAARPARRRPRPGLPRGRGRANSGASGRQPGEVTTRSAPSGSVSPSPSRTLAPAACSSAACARSRSPSPPSTATTCAPCARQGPRPPTAR